jgi:hypothetical protein
MGVKKKAVRKSKIKQYTDYPNISGQVDFATLLALKNLLLPARKT